MFLSGNFENLTWRSIASIFDRKENLVKTLDLNLSVPVESSIPFYPNDSSYDRQKERVTSEIMSAHDSRMCFKFQCLPPNVLVIPWRGSCTANSTSCGNEPERNNEVVTTWERGTRRNGDTLIKTPLKRTKNYFCTTGRVYIGFTSGATRGTIACSRCFNDKMYLFDRVWHLISLRDKRWVINSFGSFPNRISGQDSFATSCGTSGGNSYLVDA